MIQLPKTNRALKETEDLYKCQPVCKSRRRLWKSQVHNTTAELLLERKPIPVCFRRYLTRVTPNSPCSLFGRSNPVLNKRDVITTLEVERICQGSIENPVATPCLNYAEIAKKLGAWDAVHACCPFCKCGSCCPCGVREYIIDDADRAARRRPDMRSFDARVKTDCHKMRIMYDKS